MILLNKKTDDKKTYDFLISLCEKAYLKNEVPCSCIIKDKNQQIIASAYNKTEILKDPTLHAEMIAIKKALKKTGEKTLVDCTIYISKEPCLMCATAITYARISNCIYLLKDEKGGGVKSVENSKNLFKTKFEHIDNYMSHKSKTLLQNFFQSKRK